MVMPRLSWRAIKELNGLNGADVLSPQGAEAQALERRLEIGRALAAFQELPPTDQTELVAWLRRLFVPAKTALFINRRTLALHRYARDYQPACWKRVDTLMLNGAFLAAGFQPRGHVILGDYNDDDGFYADFAR